MSLELITDILIATVPLMLVFATLFAFTTWLERKALARIQNRIGPNKVGIPCTRISLFGLGQPAADGIKMLFKEDIVPRGADRLFHLLAPILALIPAMLVLCFLPLEFPWTKSLLPVQAFLLDGAVIFFFAITGLNTLAVFMAGWASRNKYSLLGGMRAVAQMVSYEIPLVLSAVIVVMMVGSLNAAVIADAQTGFNWFVFSPWGFAAFVIFFIAALAETNRSPFDLPEAESEIIAGYFHRVQRLQVRAVFPRRIHRHVRHQRSGRDAVPRRRRRPRLGCRAVAVGRVVPRKNIRAHRRDDLAARHPPPPESRPVNGVCVEIYAATFHFEHPCGWLRMARTATRQHNHHSHHLGGLDRNFIWHRQRTESTEPRERAPAQIQVRRMNEQLAFWVLAAIAVLGALVAVRKRNLIHGVFALLVFFAGLSGLFLLLLAEFIAAVQVLVYIGAVGVLLLFAIMLTERVAGDDGQRMTSRGWFWGLVMAVAVFVVLLLPAIQQCHRRKPRSRLSHQWRSLAKS